MGNLQVTKISCGREWTPHKCVLGALIRNGMGLCLLFLFLTYYLWIFMNKCWTTWDFYNEACVPKIIFIVELISAAKFWITYVKWFWRINCYLFSLWIFKKCSIPFKVEKLWFIYEIFTLGKRGVTSGVLVWQEKVSLAAEAQLVVVGVKVPVGFELDLVCLPLKHWTWFLVWIGCYLLVLTLIVWPRV